MLLNWHCPLLTLSSSVSTSTRPSCLRSGVSSLGGLSSPLAERLRELERLRLAGSSNVGGDVTREGTRFTPSESEKDAGLGT